MADVHSKAVRSKNMRAIASQDTAIEQRLAARLRELELPFTVQRRDLPGRPDFALDESRCIIFTHGCFWHHHSCHLFKVPATRTDFWLGKIAANVERDGRVVRELIGSGWRVLVVWECALRGRERLDDAALSERLEEWICAGDNYCQIDGQGIHAVPLL
ncbi:very short patch repair endonuclease [Salmonella enterica subsp. enterica serovar Choleraesuis]|nr:very short patch repair endonuclease [Salmonella enterica subsp. enterica serovar Choleraesuis]